MSDFRLQAQSAVFGRWLVRSSFDVFILLRFVCIFQDRVREATSRCILIDILDTAGMGCADAGRDARAETDAGGRGRGGRAARVECRYRTRPGLTHATTPGGGQCVLATWVAARPPPVRDARRWRAPHARGADPISLTISRRAAFVNANFGACTTPWGPKAPRPAYPPPPAPLAPQA